MNVHAVNYTHAFFDSEMSLCYVKMLITLCPPPQPLKAMPAEKIMKKPIPDEHMVLKTTFEGLIQKCLAVATDPVSSADGYDNTVDPGSEFPH